VDTEITDIKEFEGWVLYDADCRFCVRLAKRFQNLLAARRFELLPLQTPWVREHLAMENPELLAEMRLLKPDGRIFGGADAFLEICRYYRLAWPITRLGQIPVVTKIFHLGYRWIAGNRGCANGTCKVESTAVNGRKYRFTDFLPLSVLPVIAFGFRTQLPRFVCAGIALVKRQD
jgi:predicted DCC family thiol-disulfide oxidoreductase YuxK